MKRKMAALVTCGLLTGILLTGCGREETAPAAPPREVIEGNDSSEASSQADEAEEASDGTVAETQSASAESSANGMPGMTMQFGYDGPVYTV